MLKLPTLLLKGLLLTTGVVLVGMTAGLFAQQERIAVSELKAKLDAGETFILVDVREDSELEENGAIKGAIHIPMGELDNRMEDIPKDVELVFYWAGGGRASRAAKKFADAGYNAGQFCGIRDWKNEGLEIVPKVNRPAPGKISPNPKD